ncbi:MAG: glutamate 5-kinase [Elusimicrobia bacterium CG11_big_fil_rev_8_21_14_0_20_64_6]|nr:MAG: glutamate 5-kinase [Elusimicrobia bacterium CG11_big_fil_rev_8_21_14_0_20_64_6]
MGKRIVVKVGSGVLASGGERLSGATLRRLAGEIAQARAAGHEIVVVSSGAILAGRERLKLEKRPSVQLKQAAAAVGQSRLMRAWEAAFARPRVTVAQVLLSGDDLRHRGRYLNARSTMLTLLRLGVVPIVNENDTVAVEEIKFGDNDGLSALVAGLVDAGLLVLLTDQDGLYSDDPRSHPEARLIREVSAGTHTARVGKAGPSGTGGMQSKVCAARQAAEGGVLAVVANGTKAGTLTSIINGESVGTRFLPEAKPLAKRRQWLAFASHPKGRILVDGGAREALTLRSRSLLSSGIKGLSGTFEAGEVVGLSEGGVVFAHGLTNFSSRDLEKIKGLKTSQIEAALGVKPADEVVHRDNLAVLKK